MDLAGADFRPWDEPLQVVTDNDGLDETLGETVFLDLGRVERASD